MKLIITAVVLVLSVSAISILGLKDDTVDLDLLLVIDAEKLPNEYHNLKEMEPYQYSIDHKLLSQLLKSKGIKTPHDDLMMIAFKGRKIKEATFTSWNDHNRWLDFKSEKESSSDSHIHVYSMPAKFRHNLQP